MLTVLYCILLALVIMLATWFRDEKVYEYINSDIDKKDCYIRHEMFKCENPTEG